MNFGSRFQRKQSMTHDIQVTRYLTTITLITLLSGVLFWGGKTWLDYSSYERYKITSFYWADIKLSIFGNRNEKTQLFQYEDGREAEIPSREIKTNKDILSLVEKFEGQVWHNILLSLWLMSNIFLFTSGFYLGQGKFKRPARILTGTEIITAKKLRKQALKKNFKPDFTIGSVPLLKGSERNHIFVTGASNSKKTNCFHEILQQIRTRKQKALIVDTTGIFIKKYYRPGIDKILNPLDARSEPWNIWGECAEPYHFEDLASVLIPADEKEAYWYEASRTLFTAAAKQLKDHNILSTKALLALTVMKPEHEVREFFEGTLAAPIINGVTKATQHIRSNLAVKIKCLELLEDTKEPFSIRSWVADDTTEEWLFLSCPPSMQEILKPLISSWVSIAAKALRGLRESEERRLWFVLEELAALHKLPDLNAILAQISQYGGCVLAGTHDLPMLEEIYGLPLVKSIINLCQTKVVLRLEADAAERALWWFGNKETSEPLEGFPSPEGVALIDPDTAFITATGIQRLENLEGYLKISKDLPIAKVKFRKHDLPTIADSLVEKRKGEIIDFPKILKAERA
jgi:type IV conjugative transfer system coupling protein TraD